LIGTSLLKTSRWSSSGLLAKCKIHSDSIEGMLCCFCK